MRTTSDVEVGSARANLVELAKCCKMSCSNFSCTNQLRHSLEQTFQSLGYPYAGIAVTVCRYTGAGPARTGTSLLSPRPPRAPSPRPPAPRPRHRRSPQDFGQGSTEPRLLRKKSRLAEKNIGCGLCSVAESIKKTALNRL